MTDLQRLTLRASEIRTRLNELSGIETLSDEQTAEVGKLTTEYRSVETRCQAATVAGDEPAAPVTAEPTGTLEARERVALVERCELGAIFAAAFERRNTEGAEAELQSDLGLNANQIPLELLRVETRAVSPAPGSVGASEQPVVMPVFATGDAAFMGAAMPTVPSGDAVFPVLTSRPTVGGPHKDSAAVAETTGAFSAEALAPERVQASFFYRRTDASRFRGMSPALRQALSEALSEKLDAQFIAQIVTDVGRTAAAAAAETFATYQKRLIYDRIDGRFATGEMDMRYVLGSATLGNMAPLYKSGESPENFPAFLRRMTGGYRVSPHVAGVNATKQDVIARRGMRRDAVIPTWEGVTLIPDEVTKASKGEIVITAVLLAAWRIIRTAGFARLSVKHS